MSPHLILCHFYPFNILFYKSRYLRYLLFQLFLETRYIPKRRVFFRLEVTALIFMVEDLCRQL